MTRVDGGTTSPGYSYRAKRHAVRRCRCPWYADVARLGSSDQPQGNCWRETALVFAGAAGWDRAQPHRAQGKRAVTVLPPGTEPRAIAWPPVRWWIVDAGDLPTTMALDLARALIDAGGSSVHMIGQYLVPSANMQRASS